MRKGLSHTPRKATWLPSTQQARLYPGLISGVNVGCLRMFKDCQQHKGMTAWCRAMCYTVPSLLPFIANPFQQQQLPLGVETDAQLGVAYCCLTRPLILDPPNNITFSQPFLMFSAFFSQMIALTNGGSQVLKLEGAVLVAFFGTVVVLSPARRPGNPPPRKER